MALATVAHSPPSRAVFGAFPPLAAAGVPYFSLQTVSKVSQLSRAKASIVETINYGERGISHACLYSLRDHHLGCNRPRRLRGTSREGRRRRAVEAQLNYDEIALLTISPASANPGRLLAGVYLRLGDAVGLQEIRRYQRIFPPALMAVPCSSCSAQAPS